mgnify:CR=1 FL=1
MAIEAKHQIDYRETLIITSVMIYENSIEAEITGTAGDPNNENDWIQEHKMILPLGDSKFQLAFPELFEGIKETARQIVGLTRKAVENKPFYSVLFAPQKERISIQFIHTKDGQPVKPHLVEDSEYEDVRGKHKEIIDQAFLAIISLFAQESDEQFKLVRQIYAQMVAESKE